MDTNRPTLYNPAMTSAALFALLKVFALVVYLGSAVYLLVRFGLGRTAPHDILVSFFAVFLGCSVAITSLLGYVGYLDYAYVLMAVVFVALGFHGRRLRGSPPDSL